MNECVSTRESNEHVEGLKSKVTLELHKTEVEFKRYLHGISNARIRLLFKSRSGTHSLNEGIREGMV